jgi:hypothetical protein
MLRNYTPPCSDFESYKLIKLSEGVSLLAVSAMTTVTGMQHKKPIHMQGVNKIIMEFHNSMTKPTERLEIRQCSILATQEVDVVKNAIMDSSKRASESFTYATQHIFDHTAVSYVCGFLAMRSAWGMQYLTKGPANVGILPEKSYSLATNDYIILKKMYNTPAELCTLLHILKMAGVDNAYIASLSMEAPGSSMCAGKDLACYCVRLQKMIEATANTVNVAAHHASAFGRGISAAVVCRSHSDEGGFIRNVCKNMVAPKASGLLTEAPRALDRSANWAISRQQVRKWVYDTFLVFIATVVAGDPCAEMGGKIYPVTVTHSTEERGAVLENGANWMMYPTLRRNVEDWYRKHLDMMAKAYGFIAPSTYSLAPIEGYFFNEDSSPKMTRDRHLCAAEIAPFVWIEPSCISFGEVRPGYPCATLEQPLVLPIFDGEVRPAANYRELPSGDLMSGSTVLLVQQNMSFRHCGLWYVLNSAYNRQDGLAGYLATMVPRMGYTNRCAFTREGVENMAEASWGLWDTCHPHPLNGLAENFKVLWRHTSNNTKTEWLISEYKTQTVQVAQGAFMLLNHYDGPQRKTFPKYVPPSIYNALRELDPYDAMGTLDDDEFFGALTPCVGTVGGLSPTQFAHTFMTTRFGSVNLEAEPPSVELVQQPVRQLADEHPAPKKTKVSDTVEPHHEWHDQPDDGGSGYAEDERRRKNQQSDEEDVEALVEGLPHHDDETKDQGESARRTSSGHKSAFKTKGTKATVHDPAAEQAAGAAHSAHKNAAPADGMMALL